MYQVILRYSHPYCSRAITAKRLQGTLPFYEPVFMKDNSEEEAYVVSFPIFVFTVAARGAPILHPV